LGDTEAVEGWTIRPRRADKEIEVVDEATGETSITLEPRTGLFVRYRPDAVVPGAKDEFDVRLKEREAKIAERRALRESVDANTETKATNKRK
jgi:hypothetical protein